MIAPSDQWGPFAHGLPTTERVARLRALRALVHLLLGPRGRDLCRLLREAEADDALLLATVLMINALPSRDRRNVLASYAALHRTDRDA